MTVVNSNIFCNLAEILKVHYLVFRQTVNYKMKGNCYLFIQ